MAVVYNLDPYDMKDVESIECKFVTHLPAVTEFDIENYKENRKRKGGRVDRNMPSKPRDDIHIAKEWVTLKDGTRKPNLKIFKNYEKPFWVTKEHKQKYKQKKESELLENVNEYKSTESNLARNVASKLGGRYVGVKSLREVRNSPYVYGLDVSSKAYIKKAYLDKYNKTSDNQLCVLDIEEYMPKKEVVIISITMKDKIFTAVYDKYCKGGKDTLSKLDYLYDKYVPKTEITENIKREYVFCKSEIEMVAKVFSKLHQWMPDIVEVWNIGYDIPRIVKICEDNGVNPKDIFSDPRLPKEYRYFKYKEGPTSKLTEAGVFKPKDFHEQWHTVEAPATFTFIDGMSTYFYVRQGSKKVPTGYSLDSILTTELGKLFKKLKFTDGIAEKLVKLPWHNYMVENRFLEYIIYNNYDGIGPLLLDDKTLDLKTSISMLSGYSDFEIFDSGPKKIVEALHFFCLTRGMVLGSKPARVEVDKKLGLGGWIKI